MNKLRLFFVLLVFLFTRAANAQSSGPLHWPTRNYITWLQQGVVGQGQILFIGDSIFESFWWNQIPTNGHFVLNSGHGGAGIDDAIDNANKIVPVARPHLTFVLIGINDCQMPTPTTDYVGWGSKYKTLLQAAKSTDGKVVAVTILPIEDGKSLSSNFDKNCWFNLNQQVIAISNALGVPWVNANDWFGDPNASPAYWSMKTGLSADGVHPYGPGMTILYDMLNSAVSIYW